MVFLNISKKTKGNLFTGWVLLFRPGASIKQWYHKLIRIQLLGINTMILYLTMEKISYTIFAYINVLIRCLQFWKFLI